MRTGLRNTMGIYMQVILSMQQPQNIYAWMKLPMCLANLPPGLERSYCSLSWSTVMEHYLVLRMLMEERLHVLSVPVRR